MVELDGGGVDVGAVVDELVGVGNGGDDGVVGRSGSPKRLIEIPMLQDVPAARGMVTDQVPPDTHWEKDFPSMQWNTPGVQRSRLENGAAETRARKAVVSRRYLEAILYNSFFFFQLE